MAKTVKPKKHRYVVEVLVETDVKVTKKAVRESIESAFSNAGGVEVINPATHYWTEVSARVRKVDMD